MIEIKMSELRVNIENMRLWVARLRDPDATQARGALRVGESMCCLGHACDVSGLGEWLPRDEVRDFQTEDSLMEKDELVFVVDEDSSLTVMPVTIAEWFGLKGQNPRISYQPPGSLRIEATLAELNDKFELSLPEIADVIEENWPEVKVTA